MADLVENIVLSPNDPQSVTEEKMLKLFKEFSNGITLRQMRGISDAEMEAIYSMGVGFYKAGNYTDAEKVFKFLTMYDHLSARYWTAMGSVHQVQRRFAQASEAYKFALTLDIWSPKPAYYLAECLLALGQKDQALQALDVLKKYAPKDTEKGRTFLAKGEALRELINK